METVINEPKVKSPNSPQGQVKIINPKSEKFVQDVLHPIKFKLYLLYKLPMAFLARLKVESINPQQAKVSVPYGWLNQNPFKSMYFAVQSMAAELSTGIIALMAVKGTDAAVSTLIIGMESEYTKKADTKVVFTCNEGNKLFKAVSDTLETGEASVVKVHTEGVDENGDVVSRFSFTWSIKKKQSKK